MRKFFVAAAALAMSVVGAMAQSQLKASPVMEQVRGTVKMQIDQGIMPKFSGDTDPMELRRITERAQAGMPTNIPGFHADPIKIGDIDGEYCYMDGGNDEAILVYIHGGGLMCGNAASSRGYAAIYASETGYPVYTFTYRLIPEDSFPAAVDDCFNAYQDILKRHPGKPVFLLGESGGAYLCITTAMMARDNGVTMPAAIMPYSPVIDMSGALDRTLEADHDFTVTKEGLDHMAKLYTTPDNLKNKYVSPYYDDMHGMPPTLLAWDMNEHLGVDSEVLVQKFLKQGIECHFKAYPECFHAFAPLGRATPESSEVLDNTIAFIKAHIKQK
ncbi:MAG: alpha/beta hydrolase fold domain-containing protein [Bacteroidaceae bacterium]|nr:alpha/beta hydrolase fold domain-containing protein [Bacteroidaceae bacterium]